MFVESMPSKRAQRFPFAVETTLLLFGISEVVRPKFTDRTEKVSRFVQELHEEVGKIPPQRSRKRLNRHIYPGAGDDE